MTNKCEGFKDCQGTPMLVDDIQMRFCARCWDVIKRRMIREGEANE